MYVEVPVSEEPNDELDEVIPTNETAPAIDTLSEKDLLIAESYRLSRRLSELRSKIRKTQREEYELKALERQVPMIENAIKTLENKKK